MDALAYQLTYQTNRFIYNKVEVGKMPDITKNEGWKEVCAIAKPDVDWSNDTVKCSAIYQGLLRFNQKHMNQPKHIQSVMKALAIGFNLTKAALEWNHPVVGKIENGTATSTAHCRGIQWQLVMAYGGFESVTKALMYLTTLGLSKDDVNNFTKILQDHLPVDDSLPVYSPLKAPDNNLVNLDKWLNDLSLERPQRGGELLDFIGLKNSNDVNQLEDWIVNSNEVTDWADAAMLAKALRNATAHGLLSPSKVEDWGLKPAMKILVKNLGDLVVFGLQTLASPRV